MTITDNEIHVTHPSNLKMIRDQRIKIKTLTILEKERSSCFHIKKKQQRTNKQKPENVSRRMPRTLMHN